MQAVRKPKFIADADLNEDIVNAVRRRVPGCDFLTATEGGTRGLADLSVLRRGAETARLVVSSDVNTMTGEFYRFIRGMESPGLIIVPQAVPVASAIDQLCRIAEGDEDDYRNLITWVQFNVRD